PDRPLRKESVSCGWPMLTFSAPVPLRARIPTASSSTVATAAVSLGAAAAGATWYGLARRRRGR
ncbi:MAG: HAD-IB family hydrolase, partial [Mycobacteriaceae bacterium]